MKPPATPNQTQTRSRRALVVDDEENILHMLKRALRARGWEVLVATRAEDAEESLDAFAPDVVITDIRLTGLSGREGLELLAAVRARCPKGHVVIMTGYGSAEVEREALAGGASFYFEKPIDLHVLMNYLGGLDMGPDHDACGGRP